MASRMISSFRIEMSLHTTAAGGVAEVPCYVFKLLVFQKWRKYDWSRSSILSIQYVLVFCILYSVFDNGTEVGEDFADYFSFFIFRDTVCVWVFRGVM